MVSLKGIFNDPIYFYVFRYQKGINVYMNTCWVGNKSQNEVTANFMIEFSQFFMTTI